MDLVLEFLNKLKINKNDSVVIGVSAGPDSMCLLDILEKLQNKIGFRIIVAHVNHNKREESVEEEEFLKNYCLDNDIIFESMKIEKGGSLILSGPDDIFSGRHVSFPHQN